mmetsp:Transcript_4127/g.8655  ORF Transcript_4127/g.8655 Transcript_4127/m.8655 type:complete len:260 (-) Transcript_4127:292-1071(-)
MRLAAPAQLAALLRRIVLVCDDDRAPHGVSVVGIRVADQRVRHEAERPWHDGEEGERAAEGVHVGRPVFEGNVGDDQIARSVAEGVLSDDAQHGAADDRGGGALDRHLRRHDGGTHVRRHELREERLVDARGAPLAEEAEAEEADAVRGGAAGLGRDDHEEEERAEQRGEDRELRHAHAPRVGRALLRVVAEEPAEQHAEEAAAAQDAHQAGGDEVAEADVLQQDDAKAVERRPGDSAEDPLQHEQLEGAHAADEPEVR